MNTAATWRLERYTPAQASAWDALVTAAPNGPFLLRRPYLNYHADRFDDHSWLVWRGSQLRALFVAGTARYTPEPTTLVAHPGLAYGGLVTADVLKYSELEAIMDLLRETARTAGFERLVLRPVPRAFCRRPDEGLLFWLHQHGARLVARELNSVVDLTQPFRIGTWRRGNLRKARLHGAQVGPGTDYATFWALLSHNLQQRHQRQPVHTLAEIESLRDRNPGHLALYTACIGAEMVAGVLVFQDAGQGFRHTQYIASSARGKHTGAVDAVLAHLLAEPPGPYRRLSFGISTVQGAVNFGLLNQKEGFGATAEATDTYSISL